jgi:hypothetical protein
MDAWIDLLLKYIIVPVGGFLWVVHGKVQDHSLDIAVLKSEAARRDIEQAREREEMRRTVDAIFAKLDSIEQALRK